MGLSVGLSGSGVYVGGLRVGLRYGTSDLRATGVRVVWGVVFCCRG